MQLLLLLVINCFFPVETKLKQINFNFHDQYKNRLPERKTSKATSDRMILPLLVLLDILTILVVIAVAGCVLNVFLELAAFVTNKFVNIVTDLRGVPILHYPPVRKV